MPNTTNWREIRNRRPPNETAVEIEKLQIRLATLREQVGASQVELAKALGTSQSNVSQLERSNDQMLSSIAKYVHALGGELKLTAVVGGTAYTLLDDVRESAPRRRQRQSASRTKRTAARAPARRPATARAQSRGTKEAVLAALGQGGAMTASEVATAIGLGRGSVSATLSKLAKSGEAVKAQRGYSLPVASGGRSRRGSS